MATYTAEDVGTFTSLATYSDAACTALVENLAVPDDVGDGEYLSGAALTYALYTLGVVYYLKATWTPSGDSSRSIVIPFLLAPQSQVSAASTTTTTAEDGTRLQAPQLNLRVGRGGYRSSDLEPMVSAVRNRYEAEFPLPSARRAKVLHILVGKFCAHEPWSPLGITLKLEGMGEFRLGLEAS